MYVFSVRRARNNVPYLVWNLQMTSKALSYKPKPLHINMFFNLFRLGNIPDITQAGSFHEFLVDLHEKFGSIASFWYGAQFCVSLGEWKLFKDVVQLTDRPRKFYTIKTCHVEVIFGLRLREHFHCIGTSDWNTIRSFLEWSNGNQSSQTFIGGFFGQKLYPIPSWIQQG